MVRFQPEPVGMSPDRDKDSASLDINKKVHLNQP
jgi:hypothetical protein